MGMEDNGKSVGENDTKEVKYRGAKAMPFIIGNETFEKLGTIGTQSNLLVYLTTVFNMKSITATNLVNIYNGSANLATLLGAFLCDTYFGRYNTLGFASISSFLGMSVLTLTAAIHGLHPPHCESGQGRSNVCTGPTVGQVAFLLAGLAFMVVGAGGIRPCNLAFGADQFNPNTESGKRGVDSFFNWYYFTFTFAMMVSVTFIVYVQSNINWAIGLAIPAFLMFLSCMMFFIGTKIYVRVRPQGTPLASVARVIGAAFKKRHLNLAPQEEFVTFFDYVPKDSINSRLPHTPQFRFLEKGAILTKEDRVNSDGSASDPRSLSSMQQVEEVKCLIRVLPIWIAGIIYYISMVTQQNYAVFQALQSNRRLGQGNFQIPAASYTIFTMITLTIWIPIYDRLIIPLMRRITGKDKAITVLQRQGIGIALSVFAMLLSGVVEQMRRGRVLTRPTLGLDPQRGAISSLSSLWLVPQLALTGMSESFTMIGLVEFYYKQFPENMRSIGAAFLFCGCAMSSYLSSLLVSVVHRLTGGHGSGEATKRGNWLADDLNQGRLDYFYFLIAALEVANLMYFVVSARWYRYRGSSSGFDGGDSGKNEEKKSEIALV